MHFLDHQMSSLPPYIFLIVAWSVAVKQFHIFLCPADTLTGQRSHSSTYLMLYVSDHYNNYNHQQAFMDSATILQTYFANCIFGFRFVT